MKGQNCQKMSTLDIFHDMRKSNSKHFRRPIIMPAKYVAVNLRIRYAHVKPCHVGTNILVNLPRERYWILGGRRSIRNVLSLCKRQNAKRIKVPRDPLPKDRVRDAVPFEVTRIDVARPSYLKTGKKMFSCCVYCCVLLALVMSLWTHGFLQVSRGFHATWMIKCTYILIKVQTSMQKSRSVDLIGCK